MCGPNFVKCEFCVDCQIDALFQCVHHLCRDRKKVKRSQHPCSETVHLMLWWFSNTNMKIWAHDLLMRSYNPTTNCKQVYLSSLYFNMANIFKCINLRQEYCDHLACALTHRHDCTSALKSSSSGTSAAVLQRIRESKDDNVMKIWVLGCLDAIFFKW